LGAQQVVARDPEQLLVTASRPGQRVGHSGTSVAETPSERTLVGNPRRSTGASPFGLALGRREQQHWNAVRKSWPFAGHGPTLASTVTVMRVHLDAEKCQGHNRCYALAPELFDVDDYGQAMLLVEGDVPEELQDKARLAASNCPEYAITVTENG
jgi:ferredoxin